MEPQSTVQGPLGELYSAYRAGTVDRRTLLARATALGLGLPVALFILNSIKVESAVAAPAAQDAALDSTRPADGVDGQHEVASTMTLQEKARVIPGGAKRRPGIHA